MPETAAKPGGLYLILRGAFQDAGFESLRVHSLSQRALLSSVYNRPATLLLLAIRHQNDATFHHLDRDLLSGIKARGTQPLARKNDIGRGFVENIRAVSHN
jgi:hypothetical protein